MYRDPYRNMVRLGLLTEAECEQIRSRYEEFPYLSELCHLPLVWANDVIRVAYEEGHIHPRRTVVKGPHGGDGGDGAVAHDVLAGGGSDSNANTVISDLVKELRDYRITCVSVLFQAYLPFPLVLSQLVTILTYAYLLLTAVAQQDAEDEVNFNVPVFTCLDGLVYLGALRVGQIYSNPLGADDDDYEIVSFFNRNLRVAHLYGLYGSGAGTGPSEFDFHAHMPPLLSLDTVQRACIGDVPVPFYAQDQSNVGAFGKQVDLSASNGERDTGVSTRTSATSIQELRQPLVE
jgi:hypothetical protein